MATQREMDTYDRRIIERNLRQGLLSNKEYESYMKTLEDVSHKAVEISEPQPLEPPEPGDADAGEGPQEG